MLFWDQRGREVFSRVCPAALEGGWAGGLEPFTLEVDGEGEGLSILLLDYFEKVDKMDTHLKVVGDFSLLSISHTVKLLVIDISETRELIGTKMLVFFKVYHHFFNARSGF